MKKILCFLLLFCLIVLPSCQTSKPRSVVVGINLALTGVSAPYGTDALAGIRQAVELCNRKGGIHGRPVILRVLDNGSRTDLAALAARRLEEMQVCACIGPSLSHLTRAALKATSHTCLLTPGSTASPLKPFGREHAKLLRLCFTDDVQGAALASYAGKMGCKAAAIVYDPALDYAVCLSRAFEKTFCANGGRVVCKLPFTDRALETAPLLHRLQSAKPDCILLPVFYEKGGLFLRQIRLAGCRLPVFSGDGFGNDILGKIVGRPEFLEGVYYTDHADPAKIPSESGRRGAYKALGYDCATVLFSALSKLPVSAFDGPFPHDALYALLLKETVRGKTGTFSFSRNGDARKIPVLLRFEKGRPVLAREES